MLGVSKMPVGVVTIKTCVLMALWKLIPGVVSLQAGLVTNGNVIPWETVPILILCSNKPLTFNLSCTLSCWLSKIWFFSLASRNKKIGKKNVLHQMSRVRFCLRVLFIICARKKSWVSCVFNEPLELEKKARVRWVLVKLVKVTEYQNQNLSSTLNFRAKNWTLLHFKYWFLAGKIIQTCDLC